MDELSHTLKKNELAIWFCGAACRALGVVAAAGLVWLLFQALNFLQGDRWDAVDLSYVLSFVGLRQPAPSSGFLSWPLSLVLFVGGFVLIHVFNLISVILKRRVTKLKTAPGGGVA